MSREGWQDLFSVLQPNLHLQVLREPWMGRARSKTSKPFPRPPSSALPRNPSSKLEWTTLQASPSIQFQKVGSAVMVVGLPINPSLPVGVDVCTNSTGTNIETMSWSMAPQVVSRRGESGLIKAVTLTAPLLLMSWEQGVSCWEEPGSQRSESGDGRNLEFEALCRLRPQYLRAGSSSCLFSGCPLPSTSLLLSGWGPAGPAHPQTAELG
jgi:hypothetical protein